MEKFTIAEALARLEDGHWHNVAFVTADALKKTGGKIIRIKECKIISHVNQEGSKNEPVTTNHTASKSQRHSLNATRNLLLRNGLFRKMHIYTLFAIDKKPVL